MLPISGNGKGKGGWQERGRMKIGLRTGKSESKRDGGDRAWKLIKERRKEGGAYDVNRGRYRDMEGGGGGH